jgi:hypothetical protein
MAERSRDVPLVLLDVAIGTAASGLGGLARGGRAVTRLAAPVTGPAARAARTVTDRLPAVLDGPVRASGQAQRAAARAASESWLGYLVPRLVAAVLDRLDLTELVIGRVDLDRVAQHLDVEAVLDRLDLTELVIRRVDLDRVAQHLDVEAVLDRLDLTELVIRRVDLDRVAQHLDVEAVLDRLDLTELVTSRVDLDRIAGTLDIEAIAYRLDLNALAARIDLIGLAEQVVVGIDLPQLIRDSTGSVASEGIAGVRMQGMEADQALTQLVDRLLRRRRRPPLPPEQGPEQGPEQATDGQQPAIEDGAVLDGQPR